MCQQEQESKDHLFFYCPFSHHIWTNILLQRGLQRDVLGWSLKKKEKDVLGWEEELKMDSFQAQGEGFDFNFVANMLEFMYIPCMEKKKHKNISEYLKKCLIRFWNKLGS